MPAAARPTIHELGRRLAEARAKIEAHEDAQRERAIAALESVAKDAARSVALLEDLTGLLQRTLSGGGR